MGTGGKATIIFKNNLGKDYTLTKAIFRLDGTDMAVSLPLGELGTQDEGTVLCKAPSLWAHTGFKSPWISRVMGGCLIT